MKNQCIVLEGKLNFSYAKEDDIILSQGDMFTCEVAVRHGFYNAHKNVVDYLLFILF